MRPTYLALIVSLAAAPVLTGCGGSDDAPKPAAQSPQAAAPEKPVTPVSACAQLTPEKIAAVYPDKRFRIETDRNDPPNIYEALSACRYVEEGKEPYEQYYIDLEIRARQTPQDALRMLADIKDMNTDKKERLTGYGDEAYFVKSSMMSGGPSLSFVKGNVFYKLGVQTIQKGAGATLPDEVLALAKKVLE